MATYEITATMNLKNIISEAREVAKAMDEFANDLEHIEERYNKEEQSERYCTECPYFEFTGDPSDDWQGARCNKDNHETSPSMLAIQELYDECPFKPFQEALGKAESVEDEETEPCETNLQALQKMDAEELARFITDLTHYDDIDYEWKSNLTPLLPFEDWKDWLNRRAIYGKG